MYFNDQKINCPLVYLDSSNILRTPKSNLEFLTRQFAAKYPQKFHDTLAKIKTSSEYDNEYYWQINELLHQGKIFTLITLETANEMILKHNSQIIALLGKMQTSEEDNLVLWGENVAIKTYHRAAMSIVNALCIVADVNFFKISVGRSLLKYVPTECGFYILSTETVRPPMETDYVVCELTPKKFIQQLFSEH